MDKSIVFISHIGEEKELAITLKELIESSFLGMIEVFVSSDEQSISLGQKWLDSITDALKKCTVEIILCSPKSVTRPWINFEAGAGWIRDITVIPLCHSGIKPAELPVPLNLLQAASASEISSLKLIFPVLAQALGAKTPQIDFTEFIKKVTDFEEKYTFWSVCNNYLDKINQLNTELISDIKSNKSIILELAEPDIKFLESFMDFFLTHNIMQFSRSGGVEITTTGTYYKCKLIPLGKLNDMFNNSNCKYK